MFIDRDLPDWNTVPLHPETGKPWVERYQDLINLSAQMKRQTGLDAQATEAKRDHLISNTKFRNEFYIVELVPTSEPQKGTKRYPVYSCNKNTWDQLPPEVQETFLLRDPADDPNHPEGQRIIRPS